jgi:hypothetical protein
MTRPVRRRLLTALVAVAACAAVTAPTVAVGADPAPGAGRSDLVRAAAPIGGGVAMGTSRRTATTQVQRVRVNWRGNRKNPDYVNTATIPGIGSLDLICKPNDTRIRLYTERRARETQMWLQKYEVKKGKRVVAVKTPRIYQWAHADDNGRGGTGYYAHEGLNQVPSVENRSQDGYMYGVISQRRSRAQDGGTVAAPLPVTTFELTWNWNGFNHPQRYRSCSIDATLTTQFPADQRTELTWRGWQGEKTERVQSLLPGVGRLILTCADDPTVPPTVAVDPYDPADPADAQSLYLEEVVGEGEVAYQRTTRTLDLDTETGLIGPYPLPTNGTVRMRATNGTVNRWLMLSSYAVTNDRWGPHRNLCEIAAGWYTR